MAPQHVLRKSYAGPLVYVSAVILVVFAINIFFSPFSGTPDHDVSQEDISSSLSGLSLRIMPLGDSITEGYRSSAGNGYRLALAQSLEKSGADVIYIGTINTGAMANNNHSGYGGLSISQITAQSGVNETLAKNPNVVLLHAGTNDMNTVTPPELPFETAPERLEKLIDIVLGACPTAVLVVAQIIQCSCPWPGSEARIPVYNSHIPKIVSDRAELGYKILSVDMSAIGVHGTNLDDGLHPTDVGYRQMAGVWLEGIVAANERGWIDEPES